jgi:RNA polymerase sigma-70 factor, ECF subfamily
MAGVGVDVVEEVVQQAIVAARAAWPSIILDERAFRQSLHRGVIGRSDPARALGDLCAADLYLAQACATGDRRALEAFDREHLARVPVFLARHPARALADEVRQVLRERLLMPRDDGAPPRIADYSGRGPLGSWLRVATLRAASNLIRGDKAHDELDDNDLPTGALAEVPELRVLEGRYKQAFRDAFRRAFASLEPDERTLMKLHFVDGVTVRKLVPILGVSSATAGRRLQAAQRRLGDRVLAELAQATDQPAEELESVVRALMSKLEVSLSALLQ